MLQNTENIPGLCFYMFRCKRIENGQNRARQWNEYGITRPAKILFGASRFNEYIKAQVNEKVLGQKNYDKAK